MARKGLLETKEIEVGRVLKAHKALKGDEGIKGL